MQRKAKQQQKRLGAQVNQARQRAKSVKADGKPQRNIKTPPGKQPGGVRSSLLARIFGSADAPKTAQQSIPYREMFRDGVCRVNDRLYTKSMGIVLECRTAIVHKIPMLTFTAMSAMVSPR